MPCTIWTVSGDKVFVDECDYVLVANRRWYSSRTGATTYAYATKPRVYIHRLILDAQKGEFVDHIDRNGLNNVRSNIRKCTKSQNQCNQKRHSNNLTGFKGVTYYPKHKKWGAEIRFNYKRQKLGFFASPEEAHEAYKRAAVKLHGEFARFE